jgi:hypothetical protein
MSVRLFSIISVRRRMRVAIVIVASAALMLCITGAAHAAAVVTSPATVKSFHAVWFAEVVTPTDANTPVAKIQQAGRVVCNTIAVDPARNPETVAVTVADGFGLSVSGGQAVTAAALRTLCPALDRGYQTNWGKQVRLVQDEMARGTGILATAASTNRTLRVGCVRFQRSSTPLVEEVRATLTASGSWPQDTAGRLVPFESVFPSMQSHCAGAPPLYPPGS